MDAASLASYPGSGAWHPVGGQPVGASRVDETVECRLEAPRRLPAEWVQARGEAFAPRSAASRADVDLLGAGARLSAAAVRLGLTGPVEPPLAAGGFAELKCDELVRGASVFLPVQGPIGAVSAYALPAPQASYEDQCTFISFAGSLDLRIHVHGGRPLASPVIETRSSWALVAAGDSVGASLTNCSQAMIDWLVSHGGVGSARAHSLCERSATIQLDRRPSTGQGGVGTADRAVARATIPKSALDRRLQAALSAAMRPSDAASG